MTKQWFTTALAFPLVIISLYGLYYLLMVIGSLALMPVSMMVPIVIVFLILLNASVIWLTHRSLKAGGGNVKNVQLKKRYFLKVLAKTTFSLAIGGLFINVTIRKVNKDTDALVSYAQKEMYGFVVYYKIQQNSRDIQTLDAFTRELIDYLISIQATYYLCYGSYYSQSQLTVMYPGIRK